MPEGKAGERRSTMLALGITAGFCKASAIPVHCQKGNLQATALASPPLHFAQHNKQVVQVGMHSRTR